MVFLPEATLSTGQRNTHADTAFRVRDAILAGYRRRDAYRYTVISAQENGKSYTRSAVGSGVQDEENLA